MEGWRLWDHHRSRGQWGLYLLLFTLGSPLTLMKQRRFWSYLLPSSRLPSPEFDVPGYEFIPTCIHGECGREKKSCSGTFSDTWFTHNIDVDNVSNDDQTGNRPMNWLIYAHYSDVLIWCKYIKPVCTATTYEFNSCTLSFCGLRENKFAAQVQKKWNTENVLSSSLW